MNRIFKILPLILITAILIFTVLPATLYANGGTFGIELYSDSPLEPSYFILYADNCSGLTYEFIITKDSTEIYKKTGTINDEQWYKFIEVMLTETGTYSLEFTVNNYNPVTGFFKVTDWHGNNTELDVDVGSACSETKFNMSCTNFGLNDAWALRILKYIGSPELEQKYFFTAPVDDDPWSHTERCLLSEGLYLAQFNIYSAHDFEMFFIKSCNDTQSEETEIPIWVRDHEMQCWQVWINEANQFEFVFVWEYYNNNHVQIFDMAGNLVWEIDFPKGRSQFVADLPDGMYTVKTFHEAGHILQEFVIGKP